MNTWNTMPLADANQIQRVLSLLEVLTHDDSIPITAYLQDHYGASFLELLVHTGMESRLLETQLEQLCKNELVIRQISIAETRYLLNLSLCRELAMFADKLAGRGFDASRNL